METLSAIKNFSNYYGKFIQQPLSNSDIQKIIDAGLNAAAIYDQSSVHIIAVNDSEILNRMNSLLKGILCESAPALFCVLVRTPVAIGNRTFSYQDASTASQNILIAATDLGYRTRWVKADLFDIDNIGSALAPILNVPDEYQIECVIPVGLPIDNQPPKISSSNHQRGWLNQFGNK